MAGLVLATWSLEGAEGKLIKLLRKSIKLTIKITISHSGITPLLRSFLRLRRPVARTNPAMRQKSWKDLYKKWSNGLPTRSKSRR